MAVITPKSQPRASVAGDTLTSRYQKALGAALGAVVAGLVLTAGEAKALVVNVGGLDYDVTTFIGNYNDNVSKFNTQANGGVMPWWGSSADAETFRDVVGASLGTPNNCGWAGVINCGPFFGYQIWGVPPVLMVSLSLSILIQLDLVTFLSARTTTYLRGLKPH